MKLVIILVGFSNFFEQNSIKGSVCFLKICSLISKKGGIFEVYQILIECFFIFLGLWTNV